MLSASVELPSTTTGDAGTWVAKLRTVVRRSSLGASRSIRIRLGVLSWPERRPVASGSA